MKKIIALAALAAISATASANLITNGSFEATPQAAGTWNTYTSVAGWLVTEDNFFPTAHGLEIRNNVAGTAEAGSNFIELDGYENDRITTGFATTIGKTYEVSFWYANRDGVAAASEGFAATVLSGSVTNAALVGNALTSGWIEEKMYFKANSAFSIFTIAATGTSDGYGTSFDNFSAVAVPEPATLGLFAAGLAVLGLSSRRRRQQ